VTPRRVVVGALVTGVAAASVVATAFATPPGANGRIAFSRSPDASRSSGAIFTTGPTGTGERRVTPARSGVLDNQPDWAPDGRRIAFTREYADREYELWTVRPNGTDPRQVDPGCPAGIPETEICEETEPAWSPDGKRLAFFWSYGKLKQVRGEEWIEVGAIGVMDQDGANPRQLTQRRRPTTSEDHDPVWSPDGKRIAFMRWNSTASPANGRAIFVVDADGTHVRRLTPWRLEAGDHPDWSPDGRRILFRSGVSSYTRSNLWTIRPDGSDLERLTDLPPTAELFSASYAPDGRWIVFSTTGRGGLPDLFAIRPDGTGVRQITRSLVWDSAPDWGPR
jgi:Tol biopolymer transport system component